jgi:hypothetical protein
MSNLSANINSDDLVISKQDGGYYSGGFNVSSILKDGNSPVINNFSGGKKNLDTNTDIFDVFKNLSIPRGIFSMKTEHLNSKHTAKHNRPVINNDDYLDDDIVDKLLKLVEPINNNKEDQSQSPHKKTKKNKHKSKKNKTKKH